MTQQIRVVRLHYLHYVHSFSRADLVDSDYGSQHVGITFIKCTVSVVLIW